MEVSAQSGTKALDDCDGPGLAPTVAALAQPRVHGAQEDAKHLAGELVVVEQARAQPPGDCEDPLPHRNINEHLVGEIRRGVVHSAAVAPGAEAATAAGKPDEVVPAAVVAADAGEAVRDRAAAHVVAQLVDDETRKATCSLGPLEERGEVTLQDHARNVAGARRRALGRALHMRFFGRSRRVLRRNTAVRADSSQR